MAIPAAIPFALQAVSFVGNLFGASAAARRQKRIGNALAKDALQRGEESAFAYSGNVARLIGRQRTAIAAQNVDLTHGSAKKVIGETRAIGAADVAMIRLNAAREARMLKMTANAQANQTMNQGYAGALSQAGSLLTSGVDAWRWWKNRSTGTGLVPDAGLTTAARAYSGGVMG